jgi:hypothetical protein
MPPTADPAAGDPLSAEPTQPTPSAAAPLPEHRELADVAARLHDLLSAPSLADGSLDEARRLALDLHRALPARFVIERAKGVVMGRYRHDPDGAFSFLRELSQRRNTPLRLIAHEVATDGVAALEGADGEGPDRSAELLSHPRRTLGA